VYSCIFIACCVWFSVICRPALCPFAFKTPPLVPLPSAMVCQQTTAVCQARPWVASFSFISVFGWIAVSLQERILSFAKSPAYILPIRLAMASAIFLVNFIIPIIWASTGNPDGSTRVCNGPVEATMRQVTIIYNLVLLSDLHVCRPATVSPAPLLSC
jgi:hypothetical protein